MPTPLRSVWPWLVLLIPTISPPLIAAESPPFRVGMEMRGAALSDPGRTIGWGREIRGALRVSSSLEVEAGLEELKLSNNLAYLSASGGLCWSTQDSPLEVSVRAGSGRYSWNGFNGARTWELALSPRLRLSRPEQPWSWGASTQLSINKPGERTLMILSPGVWFKLGF